MKVDLSWQGVSHLGVEFTVWYWVPPLPLFRRKILKTIGFSF